VNIYSTWPGASYQYLSGTSMATPHVSGAAALAKAAFPSAGGIGLKALLLDSVDANASLSDITATGGRLNAATAVTCNATPKVWLDSPAAGFVIDAGTPVSISAIATNCADSGDIAVSASANGTPIALSPRGDGLYSGTYTPSSRGALTISVTASVGGNTKTRTVTGNAAQSYSITPGGPPVTVTTTSPDENATLRFAGQAGQRVSVAMSAVTIPVSQVSILKPTARY